MTDILKNILNDIKKVYLESPENLLYRLIKERLSNVLNTYYSDICNSIDYYENRLDKKSIKILERLNK